MIRRFSERHHLVDDGGPGIARSTTPQQPAMTLHDKLLEGRIVRNRRRPRVAIKPTDNQWNSGRQSATVNSRAPPPRSPRDRDHRAAVGVLVHGHRTHAVHPKCIARRRTAGVARRNDEPMQKAVRCGGASATFHTRLSGCAGTGRSPAAQAHLVATGRIGSIVSV